MISKSGILFNILLILLSLWVGGTEAQKKLYPGSSWNYIDYLFPTAAIRNAALNSRQFIIGNPFPIDIAAYYGCKKLF